MYLGYLNDLLSFNFRTRNGIEFEADTIQTVDRIRLIYFQSKIFMTTVMMITLKLKKLITL